MSPIGDVISDVRKSHRCRELFWFKKLKNKKHNDIRVPARELILNILLSQIQSSDCFIGFFHVK